QASEVDLHPGDPPELRTLTIAAVHHHEAAGDGPHGAEKEDRGAAVEGQDGDAVGGVDLENDPALDAQERFGEEVAGLDDEATGDLDEERRALLDDREARRRARGEVPLAVPPSADGDRHRAARELGAGEV